VSKFAFLPSSFCHTLAHSFLGKYPDLSFQQVPATKSLLAVQRDAGHYQRWDNVYVYGLSAFFSRVADLIRAFSNRQCKDPMDLTSILVSNYFLFGATQAFKKYQLETCRKSPSTTP